MIQQTRQAYLIAIGVYGGALAILAAPFLFPLVPGTVSFFLVHALTWCLASIFVVLQRRYAWESAGIHDGPPWLKDWAEPFPAWAFEGAFLTHVVDVPMAIGMAVKIFASTGTLYEAATLSLNDMPLETRYGSSMLLEHCIFASHFGIFIADFIVHISRPCPMYIAHHICAMVLLWCGSLTGTLPGVVLLAFCTPVIEIGSMSYCTWIIWRLRATYFFCMNLSNIIYFTLIVVICALAPELTCFFLGLVAGGIGLIIGRSAILVCELRTKDKLAPITVFTNRAGCHF